MDNCPECGVGWMQLHLAGCEYSGMDPTLVMAKIQSKRFHLELEAKAEARIREIVRFARLRE